MSEAIHDLYQSLPYPAMSHPSCDPATTAVAAKLAGLTTSTPASSHILEIGCSAGHNLLALAARWPEARFTGIDFSGKAIEEARETVRLLDIGNVEFIEADLGTYDPGDITYDFIIAHGFYSWVPEPVRQILLDFCRNHLAPNGIATISYNTLPGWSQRQSLTGLARLLTQRPVAEKIGRAPVDALTYLATVEAGNSPNAVQLRSVLHDMIGKSTDILMFDDFAPLNTPVTFLDFVSHTNASRLHYLGESQIYDNFPTELPAEAAEALKPLEDDPLVLQQTIDVLINRTFRHALLCRNDAPVDSKLTMATVLQFAVRCPHVFERTPQGARLIDRSGKEAGTVEHPLAIAFFSSLATTSPECVPMQEILELIRGVLRDQFDPATSLPTLARLVLNAARSKLIELRVEPVRFDSSIPSHPNLGPMRLLAAKRRQALVDIYHAPCTFLDGRYSLLSAMDGSRSVEELAALAHVNFPQLDFRRWLAHLAERGLFSPEKASA